MKGYFLLYIFLFFGCSIKENREKQILDTNTDDFNQDSIHHYINIELDSAALIYQRAIYDAEKGVSDEVIIRKYEAKAAKHHQNVANAVDSVTQLFKLHGKSQEDYEVFISKINPSEVKMKAKQLEELGIEFNLEKQPDK